MYHWNANKKAVEVFLHLDEDQRAFLLDAFDSLANSPFDQSDIILPGDAAEPFCEIKLFGELVISYYVDHAIKEVRILGIDPV